ncbi:CAP domain-containing protein [Paraburkholderia mimosarum]|uniref:CAP domain-containing protein n=1 Tax=Paraburkholderia mimosarum TaxID=312026 RepID=UPI0004034DB8|nr:CAP domain-containing protein [Paraburkholderia mimosarum]
MNNKKNFPALTALAFAAALTLAACGGGGGGNSSGSNNSASGTGNSSGTSSQTVSGTQTAPLYASTSAQSAAFTLLNQARQQCGFPTLQENTVLDKAAQNHSVWEGDNNTISDSEQSGQTGFTGATYADRATASGFPSSVYVTGASGAGNPAFPANFVAATAGQQFVADVLSGVYHVIVAGYPANITGFGEYETQTTSGSYTYTNSWQSMSFAGTQKQTISNAPLTFPCSGATGLPYKVVSESPTPPNVSASGWGQAQAVFGNSTDTIVLQTATLTDSSGTVTALQILNSTTDPAKLIPAWEAVAYPTSPLTPNATYTTTLTGTINGTPFSRTWSWTTGSYVS